MPLTLFPKVRFPFGKDKYPGRAKVDDDVAAEDALNQDGYNPADSEGFEAGEEEDDWLEFGNDQFETAAQCRMGLELDWALALAYKEGRQWLARSTTGQYLAELINEEERTRYLVSNRIAPLLQRVEAICTQSSPDVEFVPLTRNELDQKAAKVAGAIHAHYSALYDRPTQTKDRTRWCLSSTTSFLKLWWDEEMDRQMPTIDMATVMPSPEGLPTAQVAKTTVVRGGGVREEVVPGFEVYLDPTAKTWAQVRYLIHSQIKPLGWFRTMFGSKVGGDVKPDAGINTSTSNGYVDSYLQGNNYPGVGASPVSLYNNKAGRQNSAVYHEYWELPNAKRPEGLLMCYTKECILHIGPWPYRKKDAFPFIPLTYEPRSGTPYGISLSEKLVQLQMVYNRAYSVILEQMENQPDYEVAPNGSGIGPNGFERPRGVRTRIPITYDPNVGPPPQIYRGPGINESNLKFLEKTEADMRDIAGVHDVSEGVAPAGTPAEGVNLLQKADQTAHAWLRVDIERSMKDIAEWEVALETQYAPAPFLLAYAGGQGTVDENEGAAGLQYINVLREGGSFHVSVIPGSAFQETPEEKDQKMLGLYQLGVFGPPGSPDASKIYLNFSNIKDKDQIIAMIDQAQQAAMQQQQQLMQQQAQMQAQQAAAGAPDPQVAMAQEQAKAQTQIQVQQAKTQGEMDRATHQSNLDTQESARNKQMDLEAKFAEMQMQQHMGALNGVNAFGPGNEFGNNIMAH